MHRILLVSVSAVSLHAAAVCPKPLDVSAGTSLQDLATLEFGNTSYAIPIALATNARTADRFTYISNPDQLKDGARVCIPSKSEAKQLRKSWQTYERAVAIALLPRISVLAPPQVLVVVPADQPVNVVAWMRKDQTAHLKTASGEWVQTAPSETWVTVEPHLRDFCRTFMQNRKVDIAKLEERLEQRLGLAPASSKTDFVRLRLERPGPNVIFRPCVDPSADHANCSVGPPANVPADYRLWFLQQYYSSYGQSLISEFPWTSLGYTFDWATTSGNSFQRFGESEFVIHSGAPVQVVEVLSTSQY
jgi:hypothetical protein